MKNSLQYRLISWIAGCILVIGAIAGFFSFFGAFQQAYRFQDEQLIQVARLINSNRLALADAGVLSSPGANGDSPLIVQLLGNPQYRSNLPLPRNLANGFQTVDIAGHSWRLYVKQLNSGDRVAVGQRTEGRTQIARASGLRTLMPFGILLPVLIGLVVLAVRKTLGSVDRLTSELDARSESDLRPLDIAAAPHEIKPFLLSINRLLQRLGRAPTQSLHR